MFATSESSSAESAASVAGSSRQRSAVTNGNRLFVDGDGRGPWARRLRDLIDAHASDLGGADALSVAQASLIRRCATLTVELEKLEGRMSLGEDVSLDEYARCAGHLRRIHETLGIERKSKDVTPSVKDYIADKASRRASAGATVSREAEDVSPVVGSPSAVSDDPGEAAE